MSIRRLYALPILVFALAGCATHRSNSPAVFWSSENQEEPAFSYMGKTQKPDGTPTYHFIHFPSEDEFLLFSLPSKPPKGFEVVPTSGTSRFILRQVESGKQLVFVHHKEYEIFSVDDQDGYAYELVPNEDSSRPAKGLHTSKRKARPKPPPVVVGEDPGNL